MLQDQARPARTEAERKQEQVVTRGESAFAAHVAEVDDVVAADGMPDASNVLRPDSSRRNAEEFGEDRPAAQADIARNDPANVREAETRFFDGAAEGAPRGGVPLVRGRRGWHAGPAENRGRSAPAPAVGYPSRPAARAGESSR